MKKGKVDLRFAEKLHRWLEAQSNKGDPWGPTRLYEQTQHIIPLPFWGLWIKACARAQAGHKVYRSQAGPTTDEAWAAIEQHMPADFVRTIVHLLPWQPVQIGRKTCSHCGAKHNHAYLVKWCSIACKLATLEDRLWQHDDEWRTKRGLPLETEPARRHERQQKRAAG